MKTVEVYGCGDHQEQERLHLQGQNMGKTRI